MPSFFHLFCVSVEIGPVYPIISVKLLCLKTKTKYEQDKTLKQHENGESHRINFGKKNLYFQKEKVYTIISNQHNTKCNSEIYKKWMRLSSVD